MAAIVGLRRVEWHAGVLKLLEMSGSGVVAGHVLAFEDASECLGLGNWE